MKNPAASRSEISAFFSHIDAGDFDAVKAFLEKHGDEAVHYRTVPVDSTPLHYATCKGQNKIIRYLLEHGADINAQNGEGYTPLMWAAANGRAETVELLLERGADMYAKSTRGETARDRVPEHRAAEILAAFDRFIQKKEQERQAAEDRIKQERLQKQASELQTQTPKIKFNKPKQ